MVMGLQTVCLVSITGRVQGVWYRGWTVETARALGLCGWVRNRPDGSVQALFAGPDGTVQSMLSQCRQGPPAARVDSIDIQPWTGHIPTDFCQHPTG